MLLIGSILLSLLVWGFLISPKFAIILITSLIIHEYGHYYWMGKEGITKRRMFFAPPFGAVAQAEELWLSRGAESRIALAGPAFGILSVILFYILWLFYGHDLFLASMALASYINLFNLLVPVAVLDGGRIIKSVLASINYDFGKYFYWLGFIILSYAFISGYAIFLVILLGFFLFQDYKQYTQAPKQYRSLATTSQVIHECRENLKSSGGNYNSLLELEQGLLEAKGFKSIESLERVRDALSTLVNLEAMSPKSMLYNLSIFIGIISFYFMTLSYVNNFIAVSFINIVNFFL